MRKATHIVTLTGEKQAVLAAGTLQRRVQVIRTGRVVPTFQKQTAQKVINKRKTGVNMID